MKFSLACLLAFVPLFLFSDCKKQPGPTDVEPPVMVVSIPYPGASPDTVEREVVNRIEKALQGISGVDRLQSTASEGSATIVLVFDFSKNMIEAAEEVRAKLGGEAQAEDPPATEDEEEPAMPAAATADTGADSKPAAAVSADPASAPILADTPIPAPASVPPSVTKPNGLGGMLFGRAAG